MSANHIGASYAKGLVWCAIFFGFAFGVSNIAHLIFVDFIHGNPHRTQQNAVVMMVIFTPLFFLIAALGALLIFALPQILQSMAVNAIFKRFGIPYEAAVIAILPITAIITWYCYDYLTPTDCNLGINVGPDWSPYQHGLTVERYLKIFAIQAPVTLFSYLYAKYRRSRSVTTSLTVLFFMVAAIGGGVHGYYQAREQYRFIDNTLLAPTRLLASIRGRNMDGHMMAFR